MYFEPLSRLRLLDRRDVIFCAAGNWMVGCEVEDRDSLAVLGELSEWGREVRAAQAHPTAWFVSDSLSIVLPPLQLFGS